MRIVCGTNIPFARECFGTLGAVEILAGRAMTADAVRDADALIVRSTTKANAGLLERSRVRFVGTTVIGTDHLDIPYLDRRGIRWCAAPGSNANSVSEYMTAALLCLGRRHGVTLEGRTIGIVGVGNVGKRVAAKAEALGLRVLRNDPPLQRVTGGGGYVSLDRVLAESDIVTLHVPLTREGADATVHLAGEEFFRRLKPGAWFFNAARGPVTRSDSLLGALADGRVSHAVLDTWEGEPSYRPDVLARVDLGTPHIAGHSFDGKVMGTLMIYRELCRFLGVPASWTPEGLLPPPATPVLETDAAGTSDEAVLARVVQAAYDIEADDRRFRDTAALDDRGRAEAFDRLRTEYPERREFPHLRVEARGASAALRRKLGGLGFRL